MSAGTERLEAAAASRSPRRQRYTSCLACARPMRFGKARPNGLPQHGAYGLCNACYRAANKNGPGARELAAQLGAEFFDFSNSEPFSDEQLSRLGSSAPETYELIMSRRDRGIPAEGVFAAL